MIDGNLAALVALPILAAFLSIYLLKVDDSVGHLFMLMGVGLCAIALLPYVFNTPSDITTILLILGLGCIAWGLTLGKKRFRPQKNVLENCEVPSIGSSLHTAFVHTVLLSQKLKVV